MLSSIFNRAAMMWLALTAAGIVITWQCMFHPMRTVLAVVAVVVAGAIIRYPSFGLALMIASFLISASPIYQAYAILASSYTATDVLGLLVVAGVLARGYVRAPRNGELRRNSTRSILLLAVCAYFGWGILALAWSPATPLIMSQYVRHVIEDVAILALALVVLDTPVAVRRAAGMYAIVTIILALYTIMTFQQLHGFGATAATSAGQLSYRSGGIGDYNENELAVMIALVPCFAYLATQALPKMLQLLMTGATVPIVGLALLILSSRESIIAVAVAGVAALALTRDWRYRLSVGLLGVLAAGTYMAALATNHIPWYFQQRFAAAGSSDVGHRLPGWIVGLQLFAQNPIAGIGTGGFQAYITSYHVGYAAVNSPHSDYVGTLADAGLVGFLLLIFMLATLAFTIVYLARFHPASIMVFGILVVDMAAGSILLEHWVWAALGIVSTFGLTTADRLSAPKEAVEQAGPPSLAAIPSVKPATSS